MIKRYFVVVIPVAFKLPAFFSLLFVVEHYIFIHITILNLNFMIAIVRSCLSFPSTVGSSFHIYVTCKSRLFVSITQEQMTLCMGITARIMYRNKNT